MEELREKEELHEVKEEQLYFLFFTFNCASFTSKLPEYIQL